MIIGWPRFMRPKTLAAYLDVSEPTVRDLEQRGIIPRRNHIGTFDSEAVVAALAKHAGGKTDAENATIRTIDKLSRKAGTR